MSTPSAFYDMTEELNYYCLAIKNSEAPLFPYEVRYILMTAAQAADLLSEICLLTLEKIQAK